MSQSQCGSAGAKSATRSEVARVLQAGRSSVNRWLIWYEVAGVGCLKTKGVGRPVRQPKAFICKVLTLLSKQTPRTWAISAHAGVPSCSRCCSEGCAASRYIVPPSDVSCQSSVLSSAVPHRLCTSKTQTKKRNWPR